MMNTLAEKWWLCEACGNMIPTGVTHNYGCPARRMEALRERLVNGSPSWEDAAELLALEETEDA